MTDNELLHYLKKANKAGRKGWKLVSFIWGETTQSELLYLVIEKESAQPASETPWWET